MRAGRLREWIQLQRRVDNQQPGGQVKHTYETFDSTWAHVAAVAGREFFAAQQVQSEVTTKISIRFRHDVNETTRIIHVTNYDESPNWFDVYDIVAVIPDEKTNREELTLMCVKRVAEGWRG